MKEKNKLVKKFAAFSFIFLVVGLISAVCLQAQNQEKETKKKSEIKSEQTKNNTDVQQNENEDIKPPEGDQWIAPGDEELYKFDIKPITPKEGITGGVLVYYGHYIRPPYKIETITLYENGLQVGIQVIINGLIVRPYPEVIKNRFYKNEKIEEIILTEYEKKCYAKSMEARDTVLENLRNIVNEIGLKDENIKIIEKRFESFLSHSPLVSYYKLKSIWSADITFKVCNENPRFRDPVTIIFNWKSSKPEKNRAQIEKERWENRLKTKSQVIHANIGDIQTYDISELDKVAEAFQRNIEPRDIIISLYAVILNIKIAKSFFYNFEYKEYLQDRKMRIIK